MSTERAKVSFDALDAEASKMDPQNPVYFAVNGLLASACDNGTDEASRMTSLESLLCYAHEYNTPAAREWFASRGVEW